MKLYIGGELDTPTWVRSPNRGGTLTGYDTVIVGKGYKDGDADEGWNGYIDDVQIYNFPLSKAEIANVMTGNTEAPRQVNYLNTSPAELYDSRLEGERSINFEDFALLIQSFLDKQEFPLD